MWSHGAVVLSQNEGAFKWMVLCLLEFTFLHLCVMFSPMSASLFVHLFAQTDQAKISLGLKISDPNLRFPPLFVFNIS